MNSYAHGRWRVRSALMHSSRPGLSLIRTTGLLLALGIVGGCGAPTQPSQVIGATMGTSYSVLVADCETANCLQLEALIAARLQQLSRHLSHWDPDSELAAFNQTTSTDWVSVSTDLANVVSVALEISARSNGAFDITVGPAVNAWGFGPVEDSSGYPTQQPAAGTLNRALENSGYRKIIIRATPPAIRKTMPGVQLDLSALAKGYAVDQLAYLLEGLGSNNYLVEIGGEIRVAGVRAAGQPWRIGIEQPYKSNNDSLQIELAVTPGDAAIATSGDYRNFYMLTDRRVSHTIDPKTAEPVNHNLAAVSVVAPDAIQADALATALMVLGPQAGPEFASRENIAALFFVRSANVTRAIASPAFEIYLPADSSN